MSPRAEVNRTLEGVASWLAGKPDCLLSIREQLHELTGACTIIGASALREAMKNLERLVVAGETRRWSQALADTETLLEETKRIYQASLSAVDSDLKH
jgi:HPt (histidine-containing phosphotransfer) domain-containing protein